MPLKKWWRIDECPIKKISKRYSSYNQLTSGRTRCFPAKCAIVADILIGDGAINVLALFGGI